MPAFTNAIPSGGGDLNGVLYEAYETFGLAFNTGQNTGRPFPANCRSVRIGGLPSDVGNGSSAFWLPDGLNGILGAWPLAQQVQSGNTRIDPRTQGGGRSYRHLGLPIPIGYKPSLVQGGLAALPFAYQAEIEMLVRKTTVNVGGSFFFGFENEGGSMFLNNQGVMGFGASIGGTSTSILNLFLRLDGGVAPAGYTLPMIKPVDIGPSAVLLKWRVTWGRSWSAILYANGEIVAKLSESDMNYTNLDQALNTSQLHAYPVFYDGNNPIAGPYYSRATMKLVSP